MDNYFMDNFPQGRRFVTELLFFGGGGSSGGGGTQTTQTQAQMMPWSSYVPGETYAAYTKGLDYTGRQVGKGLEPEAEAQYRGKIISDTAGKFAGAQRELNENLARAGVEGGAKAEALSDLTRSKAFSTATGLSGLAEQDILEKRRNVEEARKWVGLPGSPIQTGSNSTTTSQPTGSSGGS